MGKAKGLIIAALIAVAAVAVVAMVVPQFRNVLTTGKFTPPEPSVE